VDKENIKEIQATIEADTDNRVTESILLLKVARFVNLKLSKKLSFVFFSSIY